MQVALIGYGKMGHTLETLACEKGDVVVARIDNAQDFEREQVALKRAEVAIEFSTPATAVDNIARCVQLGLPVVCGTTGWYDQLPKVRELVEAKGGALLWSPNFSIGVNITMRLARLLAQYQRRFEEYGVRIQETHHVTKLDAPSGTAIALAGPYIGAGSRYSRWALGTESTGDVLGIEAIREGTVAGIHRIIMDGPNDTIEVSHSAKGRRGFAEGALLGAHFLVGRQGVFTMDDLMGRDE